MGHFLENHPQTLKIAVVVVFLLERQLIGCRVVGWLGLCETDMDLVAEFGENLYVGKGWVEKVEFQRLYVLLSHDLLKLLLVYYLVDLLTC